MYFIRYHYLLSHIVHLVSVLGCVYYEEILHSLVARYIYILFHNYYIAEAILKNNILNG